MLQKHDVAMAAVLLTAGTLAGFMVRMGLCLAWDLGGLFLAQVLGCAVVGVWHGLCGHAPATIPGTVTMSDAASMRWLLVTGFGGSVTTFSGWQLQMARGFWGSRDGGNDGWLVRLMVAAQLAGGYVTMWATISLCQWWRQRAVKRSQSAKNFGAAEFNFDNLDAEMSDTASSGASVAATASKPRITANVALVLMFVMAALLSLISGLVTPTPFPSFVIFLAPAGMAVRVWFNQWNRATPTTPTTTTSSSTPPVPQWRREWQAVRGTFAANMLGTAIAAGLVLAVRLGVDDTPAQFEPRDRGRYGSVTPTAVIDSLCGCMTTLSAMMLEMVTTLKQSPHAPGGYLALSVLCAQLLFLAPMLVYIFKHRFTFYDRPAVRSKQAAKCF